MNFILERLDLNAGHYGVDVVVWGADGPEGPPVGCPLPWPATAYAKRCWPYRIAGN